MRKIVICLFLLVSANAFCLTGMEIAQLAVERSSILSSKEMETRALNSEAQIKGKWQNPQLMSQFGTLKSGQMQGATVEVSITQAIPLSDKFSLRKELAQEAMTTQKTQTIYFKNWVSHQAVLAGWRVHVTSELYKHGTERAQRIGLIKKYLETRPKVSIRQKVEYSIVSSQVIQLEKMQDQKKNDLHVALNDLEFWIGKRVTPSEVSLKLPDLYNVLSSFDLNTVNDVELIQAKTQLKMSSLDKDLARKEKRPDLFFGGGYRVENVAPINHFTYAIVGLNIPIWDTGSNRVEVAKSREMRDEKFLDETEKRLKLKQNNQIDLVKMSIAQLKRFPKKFIHSNEAAIHDAEFGFKQGVVDVNTFLLAETQSHEVIDQVFLSWISYLENLSTLQLMRNENLIWESK
jgi:hypothetical protein